MAEYIEREAAIKSAVGALHGVSQIVAVDVVEAIENVPAADVVEVVRCKDCKYQDDCARQMVHTTRDLVLEQNISTYNKVDYCSFGAKMDEEG